MELVCAPDGIVRAEWPKQGIRDIEQAGFRAMMLDCSLGYPARRLEKDKKTAGMETFLSCPHHMRLPLAYAPYLLPGTRRKDLNTRIQELAQQSLQLCKQHDVRCLVVRPLTAGIARDEQWRVNRAFFLHLAEAVQGASVQILLENQVRSVNGHLVRGLFSSGQEMVECVDELNAAAGTQRFGACLNMWAAGAAGQDMHAFVTAVGPRLQAVLACDTDGRGERICLPYTCASRGTSQTDWLSVIRGLREISFDGLLVLCLRDTADACPPLLRPTMMQLAKKTGEYITWQIQMEQTIARYPQRVLFGAGNMCRNYLESYGEQYPPLFTCDNNKALWGTEVAGLPVKSPEALRELPGDCAIFICNIYYREIEQQLREMGLPNPVEFFNDECPPRLHVSKVTEKDR